MAILASVSPIVPSYDCALIELITCGLVASSDDAEGLADKQRNSVSAGGVDRHSLAFWRPFSANLSGSMRLVPLRNEVNSIFDEMKCVSKSQVLRFLSQKLDIKVRVL